MSNDKKIGVHMMMDSEDMELLECMRNLISQRTPGLGYISNRQAVLVALHHTVRDYSKRVADDR